MTRERILVFSFQFSVFSFQWGRGSLCVVRGGASHQSIDNLPIVIPAKAGIHAAHPPLSDGEGPMDSRLRGNDDGQVVDALM
jgi:hypothetical protein